MGFSLDIKKSYGYNLIMKYVYLDNAATTPLSKEALTKMEPYLTETYGNPNSLHQIGRKAVKGLDEARDTIAEILGAKPSEIYFTSGGTEGDNWALRGITSASRKKHVVLTSIEHAAMLSTCKELSKEGVTYTLVAPERNGIVNLRDIENAITEDTCLVCCMFANNEIGTIQPVKEISEIAHNHGAYFFTDAVQAMGVLDIKVEELGIDMLSASAHKFGGPKGMGFVYIKSGVKLSPIITGGHQERGKRGGTSNVAGAVGTATALKVVRRDMAENNKKVLALREKFIDGVLSAKYSAKLNGDRNNRLVGNANITFEGISGEALLCQLDLHGICASNGAACSAGSVEPSYVLKEIGLSDEEAMQSLRFTFGVNNTFEEVDYTLKTLEEIIKLM